MAKIRSIQVGGLRTYLKEIKEGDARPWQSAFDKRPVPDSVEVTIEGLTGDVHADTKNHGGSEKAVLFYAFDHYTKWNEAYPHRSFGPGAFGENITVTEWDESTVCVGDIYTIGDVVLEVAQPRVPCWKISERWQEPTLTDEVRRTGWTGWHVRVRQGGLISSDSEIVLTQRGELDLTIRRLNALMSGEEDWTEELVERLQSCASLSSEWKLHIPR